MANNCVVQKNKKQLSFVSVHHSSFQTYFFVKGRTEITKGTAVKQYREAVLCG